MAFLFNRQDDVLNVRDVNLSSANHGPITADEIARQMAEYEMAHAVEDYWAFGWQVWPFLRTVLATEIYLARNFQFTIADYFAPTNDEKRGIGLLARRFTYHWRVLQNYIQWTWDVKRSATLSPSRPCDVLIFGGGERYQFVGRKWVHYPTEPLADLLERAGLRCHMWQWREQPSPAARPSANVVPSLRAELWLRNALGRFRSPPSVPDWFHEFASWYHGLIGQRLTWECLAVHLAETVPMSNIIERWLRCARPGLVVVDWWVNGPMMAAALAAHRLGIPVMDLQHGIQEQTDSAYHLWCKEPAGGWGARPDIFWVRGERAEHLLYETNRIQQEVLCGGSPWIRRWLSKTDPDLETTCAEVRKLIDGYSRSILVTLLCPASLCFQYLKAVIAKAPTNWIWLVRAHPREKVDLQCIEQELGNSGRAAVRSHNATEWPLYALLRSVDLHVSNHSTCSNEALAFGKPTVLTGEAGLAIFREFVNQGVMFYAERPENFYEIAERAFAVDPARLKHAGRSLFVVDEGDTIRAVNRVVEVVHSVRQKQALGVNVRL